VTALIRSKWKQQRGRADLDFHTYQPSLSYVVWFIDLTGSKVGCGIWVSISFGLINLFICTGLLKTSSRLTRGMAQDGAFPLSEKMAKISAKLNLPLNAFLICLGVQVLFTTISMAGTSAFTSLVCAAAVSYQIAYTTPIIVVSYLSQTEGLRCTSIL
jgi:choline transport protein